MKEVIMKVPSFSADYPKAPIYVAELVRCKECKSWHKNIKEGEDIPVHDACYYFKADDFCSYGERKESE